MEQLFLKGKMVKVTWVRDNNKWTSFFHWMFLCKLDNKVLLQTFDTIFILQNNLCEFETHIKIQVL